LLSECYVDNLQDKLNTSNLDQRAAVYRSANVDRFDEFWTDKLEYQSFYVLLMTRLV